MFINLRTRQSIAFLACMALVGGSGCKDQLKPARSDMPVRTQAEEFVKPDPDTMVVVDPTGTNAKQVWLRPTKLVACNTGNEADESASKTILADPDSIVTPTVRVVFEAEPGRNQLYRIYVPRKQKKHRSVDIDGPMPSTRVTVRLSNSGCTLSGATSADYRIAYVGVPDEVAAAAPSPPGWTSGYVKHFSGYALAVPQ